MAYKHALSKCYIHKKYKVLPYSFVKTKHACQAVELLSAGLSTAQGPKPSWNQHVILQCFSLAFPKLLYCSWFLTFRIRGFMEMEFRPDCWNHNNNLDRKVLRICHVFSRSCKIVSMGYQIAVSLDTWQYRSSACITFLRLCRYGKSLTWCSEIRHLSKERDSFNPRKTPHANCAEHAQKEKTSLPHRLPVAWTKERLEPT